MPISKLMRIKKIKAKKCVEIWTLHSFQLVVCHSFLPITSFSGAFVSNYFNGFEISVS
jgi:hypothetical protein